MQAIVFCGLQAAGKSTFYKARFADTHVRINLDMLRTRARERCLLQACLSAKLPFVVDNTNPTRDDRRRYLAPAREAGFETLAYFFDVPLPDVIERNARRSDKAPIPTAGIRGTANRIEMPRPAEGIDRVYVVTIDPARGFMVHAA
ncbi:MAG TPA: ATP-binding protein [Gammaproteobacteria bacterium]|nr:ATP-binding protein [Gammaproteobacteria bacterium]